MWRCTYLGFVDNFLSSYELESLTHVCIERFINIWYTYNGKLTTRTYHILIIKLPLLTL